MDEQFRRYAPDERESLARRLEAVAIGRPIWRIVEHHYNWRLSRLLPKESSGSVEVQSTAVQHRKIRACSNRAHDRVHFGRKVSFAMRHVATHLRRSQVSPSTIRDLIYGRVIGPDGQQRMSQSTACIILILGIVWQALGLLVTSILIALAIGMAGLTAASAVVSGLVLLFWLFAFGHINAIAIRPSMAAVKMKSWSLGL